MTNKEVVKRLQTLGFIMIRDGSRHQLWRRENLIIPISHGTGCPRWADAKLRMLERRIGK